MSAPESTRQRKFAKEMLRELSALFQRDIGGMEGIMLTITQVKVTPDLKLLRVYYTLFPDNERKAIEAFLETENTEIRHLLAQRIRHTVKSIPELEFYYDDTRERANHMDKLFEKIHKEDERLAKLRGDEPVDEPAAPEDEPVQD